MRKVWKYWVWWYVLIACVALWHFYKEEYIWGITAVALMCILFTMRVFTTIAENERTAKPTRSGTIQEFAGCWTICTVYDSVGNSAKQIIGYRVIWSLPDDDGNVLLVRHYLTDPEDPKAHSVTWCKNAAESDAKRFNDDRRMPFEFHGGSTIPLSR